MTIEAVDGRHLRFEVPSSKIGVGRIVVDSFDELDRIEALVAAGAPQAKATRTESGSAPGTAPISGLAAPPSVHAGAGVAVAAGRLAATPGSAEFAHQLGAQVTTFVRDGVQHARLQLHPAELGPVTVQIQLDGQAAKIIFSAENPFTRQALEQSMPQLAGSLREAGLTLSGGGVFEQPRQPGDGAPDRSPGGLAGHGAGDEAGVENVLRPAASAPRRRGVVDLVA